jgi:large subunit ribosomal protein L31
VPPDFVQGAAMKSGIHPDYREVVFVDSSTGVKFLIGSTIKTDKTTDYEGKKLPLVTVDISSASHPFFTGKQKFLDTAGRVEKFQKKYKWGQKAEEAKAEGQA